MRGKIFYPFNIKTLFILVGTDIFKFKTVGFVSGTEGLLIPFVSCGIDIIRGGYPSRLAPPKHIQSKLRVYFFSVRRKLITCPSGNVGFFVFVSHYRRFGS